jgi:hypothetical protein
VAEEIAFGATNYCVEASQNVSFWTPLDPVSRSVTLECIAGSPPFPHLTLENGAPFDAPDFPVIYRR